MNLTLTPESLVMILATVLAVIFDWVPVLRDKFDQYSDGQKRGFMAGGVVVMAGVVFGLGCGGLLSGIISGVPACTPEGAKDMIPVIIMAIVTNQGVHAGTKPSNRQKAFMRAEMSAGQNLKGK